MKQRYFTAIVSCTQYVYTCYIIIIQVIDKTLSSHSDELLRNEELPSLLDCCVSYHVVYHCNKPHIHHYRELGNIFPDLHKISKDALTEFPHEVTFLRKIL